MNIFFKKIVDIVKGNKNSDFSTQQNQVYIPSQSKEIFNSEIMPNRSYDVVDDWQQSAEDRAKELEQLYLKCYPSKNGLLPTEILVLYYARSFNTDRTDFQSFWKYEYGIFDVKSILNKLSEMGFIRTATALESVETLTIPELKDILRKIGAKVSGKKAELIDRIFESGVETEFLEQTITKRSYQLTDLGVSELEENQYVSYFHKVKEKYVMDIIWMNIQLHKYPNSNYRDLMWGEFNRRRMKSMERIAIGDYSYYIREGSRMCDFLFEENKYENALTILSEITYYDVNIYSSSYFYYNRRAMSPAS